MTSALPKTIDPQLSDDVVALRRQVHEQLQIIAGRDRDIVYKDAKIAALTHEIARIKRWIFAARSEKLDPAQRALFDESLGEDSAALQVQLDALRDPAAPPRNPPK